MNVMLVSQCGKRALKETRRILDQFAERRGDRSWQTAITLEGLKTLHRLLRKTARKNTAVACFWIRGHNHSELLWIVGDARQFNERGGTPTNTTRRNILRMEDEDDWLCGEAIRLLAALAALMHDLGKASLAFQDKLEKGKRIADVYRHEWVSLRLFQALVGEAQDDKAWLERLKNLGDEEAKRLLENLVRDGVDPTTRPPMKKLPSLAQAVGWLILSHHRLPTNPDRNAGTRDKSLNRLPGSLKADWCGERQQRQDEKDQDFQKLKEHCWQFPKGTPFDSKAWRKRAARFARRMLEHERLFEQNWLDNVYALHLARLGLMLADHYYSSLPAQPRFGDRDYPLHANTDADGQLKQRLDEHLLGVEANASRLLWQLPRLNRQVSRIARHKGFTRRTSNPHFAWQNKAHDLAVGLRQRARKHGFFGVNMASTGKGKTFANGRILYALADPKNGARFNIALGLRTLTLQTGDAYRKHLNLGSEDMAVLVGGGAIRELHAQQRQPDDPPKPADRGSESLENLLDDSNFVHYDGSLEDGPLSQWLKKSPDAQKLLAAPILVSTIDHLMPATESTRGGHQIAPMLRLLTSDLVLDEPDDFDLSDLPALTRLVHWAGMLGSNVLLSSATLPPALVQGLFDAWRAGRTVFQQNRGEPGRAVNPVCAWFDEFGCMAEDCPDTITFFAHHQRFVEKRLGKLAKEQQKRRAYIQPMDIPSPSPREEIYPAWANILRETATRLHANHHVIDPSTGKRLSCGLIRMAHIRDIIGTARELLGQGAQENQRIHLCVYHSRHPLLMRAAIEEKLDRLLKREEGDARLFQQPEIRAMLDQHDEPDQLFIVLASPVSEVGRDHDYDWAIVEPSSIRSLIQLAGRIRRHRGAPESDAPNIALMQTNIAHLLKGMTAPAFCHPGFETTLSGTKKPLLNSHDLNDLITDEQLARIDASARIRERDRLAPRNNLADLEHAQLRVLMGHDKKIPEIPSRTPVTHWYQTRAHLSGELQRVQPFRDDPVKNVRYYLDIDEDGEFSFLRFEKHGPATDHSGRLSIDKADFAENIMLFGAPDYAEQLARLAGRMDMEMSDCARRFGIIDLPERQGQQPDWLYDPALGVSKKPRV
ncbi:MAG TPA: type I-F CRISPR-associated helicase Cas3 [Gammaproteobacteria bacterium]|nr:type I-F CRISPR-associated helicase Cas3 [Gammaproteobacteria bacterium]